MLQIVIIICENASGISAEGAVHHVIHKEGGQYGKLVCPPDFLCVDDLLGGYNDMFCCPGDDLDGGGDAVKLAVALRVGPGHMDNGKIRRQLRYNPAPLAGKRVVKFHHLPVLVKILYLTEIGANHDLDRHEGNAHGGGKKTVCDAEMAIVLRPDRSLLCTAAKVWTASVFRHIV